MPTRQDQVHSYQYVQQRIVSAIAMHDPDLPRSPMRQAGLTALGSLLVAALAVGAVAIYGLVTGGSTVNPRDSAAIFQEKGTGAQYVYLREDDRLHPVLNYASALLLTDGTGQRVHNVAAKRLAGVPLGRPLGIRDAPDSLPAAAQLQRGAWSVCTRDADGGPMSTVLVGTAAASGASITSTGQALLVEVPGGQTFLVFGSRRFTLPRGQEKATLRALGWATRTPWPVDPAWINAVPAGSDLRAPALPEGGQSSDIVPGLRSGQLVSDRPGGSAAVLMPDGIAEVTDLQARLLQAQAGLAAPEPVADFLNLPPSRVRVGAGQDDLPASAPPMAERTPQTACVTVPGDRADLVNIQVNPEIPDGVPVTGGPDTVRADEVHVARTGGAVVASVSSPEAPAKTGTVVVVTDSGIGYSLVSRDLLPKLGYGGVSPTPVPSQLVSLLAPGPALDPAAAARPVETS